MNALEEKIEGTIHLLLYILQKLGGRSDIHKLFKILYFAEQKHLVRYGTAISQDHYHAMKNGPVPSIAYDIYKSVKDGGVTYARYFLAKDLTDKSHDKAWDETARDKEISPVAIAKAGGADGHMVKYIEDQLLIHSAKFE